MEITEVKVFPVNEDKLKAYVTIIFDNCFVVRDLKIINGNTGLFVAMPSKKRKDGTFRDIAHPLNSEMRTQIEKKILQVYEQELKTMTENAHKSMAALGQKRGQDDDDPR
jgi:stage V sporulation protein G